ncbi:DUF1772 domain-containing protein [Niabella beijingensis]|uniref:DUF1772 domain-containing protein n=1 Tax=Niabella beijingensis TaxID=2872700 RepID=UPI001CBDEA26|nr:DUF1772 domain-containing protein [Niabella beijingensis]MBZ4190928.1 DUF1772 domain-containing protein [Niabella beijingensis]
MKKKLLCGISLLLVMLVTGVFWGTWFTLTRSIDSFPADNFINIGKAIIANVGIPMRVLMPLALLMLLLLCLATLKTRGPLLLFTGALIFMVCTLLITVMVEVPIDNRIKTWTNTTVPDDWTVLRAKWARFHFYRTCTGILSFLLLTTGVIAWLSGRDRLVFPPSGQ